MEITDAIDEQDIKESIVERTRSLAKNEDLNHVSMIAKNQTKDPIKISFRNVNYTVKVKCN